MLTAIRDALLAADWSNARPRGKLAALTALMLVAHDVDEDGAREISVELARERRVHSLFLSRLASINRFTDDDYYDGTLCGLRVLVSKALGKPDRPRELLARWLSVVPPEDRSGLVRIYVTERTQDRFWGEYFRVLSQIVLIWRKGAASRPRARLATEFTLYHEFGHHINRMENLAKEESEGRADAYAVARVRDAHSLLGWGSFGPITAMIVMGRPLGATEPLRLAGRSQDRP